MESKPNRTKFLIGGLLIVAAVVYLIFSSTQANAQFFLTVNEIEQRSAEIGDRELRVSGAVIGDSISYDPNSLTLEFTVAHVPGENKEIEAQGGLIRLRSHRGRGTAQESPACKLSTHLRVLQ